MILENTFFEKVSYEQFKKDMIENTYLSTNNDNKFVEEFIKEMYNSIELPTRATDGSAGYDFKCTYPVVIVDDIKTVIPTGIKASIDKDWCLVGMPKSGLGTKYNMRLYNTIGLIDSDYYNNEKNEGHILFTVTAKEDFKLEKGQKFIQGVFLPYGITVDDNNVDKQKRKGGFGSTGK